MDSTSPSLLNRLRNQQDSSSAWSRFVELYAPLIYHWGQQRGLSATDAGDLVQDVLTNLLVQLPKFEYNPNKRFRGWLRQVTINKTNDLHRRNSRVPVTNDSKTLRNVPFESENDLFEEQQYRHYLLKRAREIIEVEFEPTTWQACWKQMTNGLTASAVGRELGISPNAARVAKCRVLRRLREELEGLLE